jgi:hypothetical protein
MLFYSNAPFVAAMLPIAYIVLPDVNKPRTWTKRAEKHFDEKKSLFEAQLEDEAEAEDDENAEDEGGDGTEKLKKGKEAKKPPPPFDFQVTHEPDT